MDVDTVWQWSMRLWFLIIAREETDGQRLSGWERTENEGRFTKNQWVPQPLFTFNPAGTMTCISPWWFISSFPQNTFHSFNHHVYTKHKPVAMEMAADTDGMGRMNLKQWLDGDLEEPSEDVSLTLEARAEWGWYLTLRVDPIEGIDICMDRGEAVERDNHLHLGR